MKNKKELLRLKRHRSIRLNMSGNKERPRLLIHRSIKSLSAQVIDDAENKIFFSLSMQNKDLKQKITNTQNVKAVVLFAQVFAQQLKEKGINKIIFDRAGYLYHGRIKAFADGLRKGGIEF